MATVTLTTCVGQTRVSTLDRGELEKSWYRPFGGMLPVKSRNLLNDASADVSGGMLVVLAATVLSLGAKSRLEADGAGSCCAVLVCRFVDAHFSNIIFT